MPLKFPRVKLHNKIILAPVFGALLGAVFNISNYEIEINFVVREPAIAA